MSTPTPGPWIWIDADELMSEPEWLAYEAWWQSPEYAGKWVEDFHSRPVAIVETDGGCYGPRGADRPLIAAAPALLKALKGMVARFYRDGGAMLSAPEVVAAESAISRAEGKGQAA